MDKDKNEKEVLLPGATEGNLSLLRKYIFEFVLIVLVIGVIKQQTQIANNEDNIRRYMMEDRAEMLKVIANNTRVIEKFMDRK